MNKILVIGDLMIDNYLIGSALRMSPEAPVPVVDIEREKSVLGGAGNVVNNLLSLGASVDIISVLGDCDNANLLKNMLHEKNISSNYLIFEPQRLTSKKTRIIASKQQVVRFDKESTDNITCESVQQIVTIYNDILSHYQIVILSDYGKGVLTDNLTKQLITIANDNRIKVLVDPKGDDYTKYSGAYLLTPNKKEAEAVLKIQINSDNLKTAISKLKADYNLQVSLITLSEEGIAIFDNKLRTHPTSVKDVFDVTGAGDTVIAAIALQLMQNQNIDEAVKFANLAAGIVVAKIGSATATLEEINYQYGNKIVTCESIQSIAQSIKQQNKKIVFTNGCFDILHLGHIKYLEEAKKCGDVLIIGVNTDNSVKKLKGENRPINQENDRVYLLNSLEVVDFVVLFNEKTPCELIKKIKPDVLVKGADYQDKTIVGSEFAKETKLIEFIAGKSTTNLIKKIKNDSEIL